MRRTDQHDRRRVLGVDIVDITKNEAVEVIGSLLSDPGRRSHSVFFANTHTLNHACDDSDYRRVLNEASFVFGDGTGVRWATRLLRGVKIKDNLNGTDLIPALFRATAGNKYRCYLLGHSESGISRAAEFFRRKFPGWDLVGYHHGFIKPEDNAQVVDEINAARPHILLVGMGNPLQERWINDNVAQLKVPVCVGVGGLFTYWSGDLVRAPLWMREAGHEWLYLLSRQPHKFKRYVLGNPMFLARVAATRLGLQGALE